LTTLQSLQIWTSLFYTLYMHDTRASAPLSTQTLIATITTILLTTKITQGNPRLKLALTIGFWETICREWNGIDQHRLDKYLLLIRFMLRAVFMLLYDSTRGDATEEEIDAAKGQVEVLGRWPLSTGRGSGDGRKVPDGVRYHVLDVWVDELETSFQDGEVEAEQVESREEDEKRRKAVLEMVTGLVEGVAKDALTKGVRLRAKDVLADERLGGWR
jgi:ribosomal RNA-processing protein 1